MIRAWRRPGEVRDTAGARAGERRGASGRDCASASSNDAAVPARLDALDDEGIGARARRQVAPRSGDGHGEPTHRGPARARRRERSSRGGQPNVNETIGDRVVSQTTSIFGLQRRRPRTGGRRARRPAARVLGRRTATRRPTSARLGGYPSARRTVDGKWCGRSARVGRIARSRSASRYPAARKPSAPAPDTAAASAGWTGRPRAAPGRSGRRGPRGHRCDRDTSSLGVRIGRSSVTGAPQGTRRRQVPDHHVDVGAPRDRRGRCAPSSVSVRGACERHARRWSDTAEDEGVRGVRDAGTTEGGGAG